MVKKNCKDCPLYKDKCLSGLPPDRRIYPQCKKDAIKYYRSCANCFYFEEKRLEDFPLIDGECKRSKIFNYMQWNNTCMHQKPKEI